MDDDPVAIKQPFKPSTSQCDRLQKDYQFEELVDDNSLSNVQQARSKVSRSSDLDAINFSNSSRRLRIRSWFVLALVSLGLLCAKL